MLTAKLPGLNDVDFSATGRALLGASPGQTIACELAGAVRRIRVEEVVHQPERSLRARLVVRS